MVSGVYQVPLKKMIGTTRPSYVTGEPALAWPFTVGPENLLVEPAIQKWMSIGHNKNSCWDDSNQGASVYQSAHANQWANPLVFCGESGLGKTHLALGLAEIWFEQHDPHRTKGLVIAAPDWVRLLREAIGDHRLAQWRDDCRNYEMLVIDDVHLLHRHQYAQQHLMVLIDDLVTQGAPIIITSSGDPIQQSGLLPGLASRLASGLTVHLKQPGLAARQVIARERALRRGWQFTESATNRVAVAVSGSVPVLAAALARCATLLGANQRTIHKSQVDQYFQTEDAMERLSVGQIAKCIARYFQLPLSRLVGRSRRKSVVLARSIAVYLSRHLTPSTLEEIGQFFGGRDHSTILHSYNRLESRLPDEPDLRSNVAELARILTTHNTN